MKNTGKWSQRATALALVGALGVAVYLNWQYASPFHTKAESPENLVSAAANTDFNEQPVTETAAARPDDETETETEVETNAPVAVPVMDGLVTEQEALDSADKNYGEAQLVSVTKDSGSKFFESARLERTKTRDGVLDDLEKRLKKSSLTDEEKADLTQKMTDHLNIVTTENEVETLVKAKGFADCLCFLNDGKADMTVMTVSGSGLNAKQVAQIRDILLSKCPELSAQDITLVEVK